MSVNRAIQYRFRLVYNSTSHGNLNQVITPIYDKGLVLSTERESEEYFYRTKCSYKFILARPNYQYIINGPFDADYEIILESNTEGAGWVEKWKGIFAYTDCEIDEDKQTVRFSAETNDIYEDILNNWEREFNLFDLDIGTTDITYLQKGLMQFYVLGSDVITNYTQNGTYYDQKISAPTYDADDLETTYFFSELTTLKVWVAGSGNVSPDISGYYNYNSGSGTYVNGSYKLGLVTCNRIFKSNDVVNLDEHVDFDSVWSVGGNNFIFKGILKYDGQSNLFFQAQGVNTAASSGTLTHVSGATNTADIDYVDTEDIGTSGIRLSIQQTSDSANLFLAGSTYITAADIVFGNYFEKVVSPTGYIIEAISSTEKTSLHIVGVQVRVLTNQATVGSETVNTLPENDIVNTVYKYALQPAAFTDVHFSDDNSTTDNFFGRFSGNSPNYPNNYFVRPTTPVGLIPLSQGSWQFASMWFTSNATLNGLSLAGRTVKTIEAFKLSDVISALLGEFSTATFQDDTNHSSFLYSETNPISAETNNDIYITPKSNITNNNYDFAATKANIKLKDLIDSLKIIYHAGWHVDSSDRFRIEHALWYWYGGQNTAKLLSYDLTNLTNPKNGKLWSFGTNKYSYEKSEIPSQSTFDWMDEQSDIFEGIPIEYTDKYVNKSYIDQNQVTILGSDIDAMTSNPDNFSKEGFVILDVNEFLDVNYEFINYKGINMSVQNARYTFPYIHDKYYRKPSKCGRTTINGNTSFNTGFIDRTKIQEIEFPLSTVSFDPIGLIKSQIGDGKVGSFTENITTHEIKAKLRHETKK